MTEQTTTTAGKTDEKSEGTKTLTSNFFRDYERTKIEGDGEDGGEYKVGHAGLYWEEDGSAHLTDNKGVTEVINATMELGKSGKGKLLTLCEEGIANAVRELADDEDNHLPNTKTGIVVHYVTEGIARDFGITFDRMPTSLGGNRGGASKSSYEKGERGLSKKEKNLLLEKLDMSYYQDGIASGAITMEQALSSIQEAFKQKQDLEAKGYYLSPNKTEGVLLYDWKKAVSKGYEEKGSTISAAQIYIREKIEVVIPDVFDNYFAENHKRANKKNAQHVLKSSLATAAINDGAKFGIPYFGLATRITNSVAPHKNVAASGMTDRQPLSTTRAQQQEYGGIEQVDEVTCQQDILEMIGFDKKGTVMGVHLAKIKKSGMMKPRYIVVDVLEGGKQTLYLYHQDSTLTLR